MIWPCVELQRDTLLVSDMANPLRGEVIKLYKCLLYLGREYPKGSAYFRDRLKSAFMKNKDVTDPEEIRKLVARGDFVIKELEALYFLRKYRTMKKRYYDPEK
nr:PREDICTED: LYR motif-containing protein 5A isoform X1 [Paralichthys olivaceus]